MVSNEDFHWFHIPYDPSAKQPELQAEPPFSNQNYQVLSIQEKEAQLSSTTADSNHLSDFNKSKTSPSSAMYDCIYDKDGNKMFSPDHLTNRPSVNPTFT